MLPLAATNAAGVVLFGALYASAGAGYVPQGLFVAGLAVLFVLMTALWVRGETQNRRADPVRRVVLAFLALVAVLVAAPALTLAPLFWLDEKLPPDAGFTRLLAPIMTVELFALVLVVLVNLVGGVVVGVRGLMRHRPPVV